LVGPVDMLLVCRVEEGGAELFFAFPFLGALIELPP